MVLPTQMKRLLYLVKVMDQPITSMLVSTVAITRAGYVSGSKSGKIAGEMNLATINDLKYVLSNKLNIKNSNILRTGIGIMV